MASEEKVFLYDGSNWTEHPASPRLAEKLSREHATIAVEWSIHTTVDQVWIVAYEGGRNVRELRYASGEGWTKRGRPLPFENGPELGKWLRKRRLLASPDGYEVLDAFLGKKPPPPVVDAGATYATSFSPAHAAELHAIAERAHVTVSEVFEAAWHLAKNEIYDRKMKRAEKLGLNLAMLVEDTAPPLPLEVVPAFVHEAVEAPSIVLTRYESNAVPHDLALSPRMLAELDRLSTMFSVAKYNLLDEAYLQARPRLVPL